MLPDLKSDQIYLPVSGVYPLKHDTSFGDGQVNHRPGELQPPTQL